MNSIDLFILLCCGIILNGNILTTHRNNGMKKERKNTYTIIRLLTTSNKLYFVSVAFFSIFSTNIDNNIVEHYLMMDFVILLEIITTDRPVQSYLHNINRHKLNIFQNGINMWFFVMFVISQNIYKFFFSVFLIEIYSQKFRFFFRFFFFYCALRLAYDIYVRHDVVLLERGLHLNSNV